MKESKVLNRDQGPRRRGLRADESRKYGLRAAAALLWLLAVLTLSGCGAFGSGAPAGSSGPGSGTGSGSESAETGAVQPMSAEAVLQEELLALTLHGYSMAEISAEDLQVLGGLADLESAAKVLEALRRAMEEKGTKPQYHPEDITALLPTTEEDRKSGLSPRELAGTVHGWQDDAGEFHFFVSAGNEIFWIRWGAEKTGAALITGKWGD